MEVEVGVGKNGRAKEGGKPARMIFGFWSCGYTFSSFLRSVPREKSQASDKEVACFEAKLWAFLGAGGSSSRAISLQAAAPPPPHPPLPRRFYSGWKEMPLERFALGKCIRLLYLRTPAALLHHNGLFLARSRPTCSAGSTSLQFSRLSPQSG